MEDKGSIYKEPDSKDSRGKPSSYRDLKPTRARERTMQSSIGFTLLMLIVLGLAFAIIRHVEQKELEDVEKGLVSTGTVQSTSTAEVEAVRPLIELDRPREESFVETIDARKMARAMEEIRAAKEYAEAKNWDGAELHIRQALDIWPDMNAAYRLLGFIYTQRGQFDQAIVAFERALEIAPFNAETFNNLGTAYMHKGLMDKAENMFFTALDIRPKYHIVRLNLGLMYLRQGRYEDAVEQFEQSVDYVLNDEGARNNLAVALLRLGRYDDAREQLSKILISAPNEAAAYFNMAITHVLEQDFDTAVEWIEKGAERCSVLQCQTYLSDSDFDSLKGHPGYEKVLRELYPKAQALPAMNQPQR